MPTDLPERGDPPNDERPNQIKRASEHSDRHNNGSDGSSFRLAVVAGIPIRIHVTFLLLLAWFGFTGSPGGKGQSTGAGIVFILSLFGCVLLHELSHALVARHYKIKTLSITLYPIGGIALLESPPSPRNELWIALAGPATNLAISGILFAAIKLMRLPVGAFHIGQSGASLLSDLAFANLVLGAFNMLPAFPMDGGRVLRALIARVTDAQRATQIAAAVGQLMAIAFGLFALATGDFVLFLVAAFVYLGAGQEANAHRVRSLVLGHRVSEAMQTEVRTLPVGSTLKEAAQALLSGSQHDFPIVHGKEVVGLLTRESLMRGIAASDDNTYVAGVMDRDFARISPDEDLESVISGLGKAGSVLVFAADGAEGAGEFVGMLTQENAIEFLMLQQLSERKRRAAGGS